MKAAEDPPPRAKSLFARMWHALLALLLLAFLINAFLVVGVLQLGSESQTERRLASIGEYWSTQPRLEEPRGLDPVTMVYPRYEQMPRNIRHLLSPEARGIFELGPSTQDYFVLARSLSDGSTFYVVESHSEVKPGDTMRYQVITWYLYASVPLSLLLLWVCRRVTARVTAPMQDVGRQVMARPGASLEPLALPAGAPAELDALVRQLNSAFRRTADALVRERSFTRFSSHELRTPVAVVQAAIERIEAHRTAEQVRPLERARRGLLDMEALVDTFLQLSREASPGAPDRETVTIDTAWLHSLHAHVTGGHPMHELRIEETGRLIVHAPATMLHVLLGNMLKNALFHGGAGPITVRIAPDVLEMRNAVPEEPSRSGFGLGRQIADRICEQLGWTFSLDVGSADAIARVRFERDSARDPLR